MTATTHHCLSRRLISDEGGSSIGEATGVGEGGKKTGAMDRALGRPVIMYC
jgi:hypothetical protein